LPRKWGKLGAKPAARRESEPVSPPTNTLVPAQRSLSSERGFGGGAPESACSLPEAKPSYELIGRLLSAKTSELNIRLRLRRAK
jgi:hypothetical protein